MTMTESPPTEDVVDEENTRDRASTGFYSLLATSDHKTVGRLYIGCSLVLAVGTTIVGVLLGLERVDAARPDDVFGGLNAYFQMWALYRVSFVLFVVMPLLLGIAMVVVPLQIGATNIAFPRAALASFWTWLLGTGITIVAVFAGGGWGALDGVTADERDAIALTLVATALTVVALLAGGLCVATTVISLRTAGMNLMRVPLFAWSMLVATSVWLVTLPILIANIGLIYIDLRGRDPIAFGAISPDPDAGIWAQLDWAFTQPAIYMVAIPVLGIAADVVPVTARLRQRHHSVLVAAIGLSGLLAIGGWMQPFMTAPADHRDELVHVAFGLAAVLPVLVVLGLVADTARRGVGNLVAAPSTALLGAVGALLLVEGAVVTGALRVIEPFELLERSTTTAVFNGAVVASLLAGLAGLWYWAPKILGTSLAEGVGRLTVVAVFVGGVALVAPQAISGFFLAPDVMLAEPDESIVDALDVISLIGSIVVSLGVLGGVLVVAAAAAARRRGRPGAEADPWGGHTLEWSTTSPPPPGNFSEPPARVVSERPLLDQRGEGEGS